MFGATRFAIWREHSPGLPEHLNVPLHLGALVIAFALSAAACGGAGVSNRTAAMNGSGSGEGVASGNGTATLTWNPPTQKTDGTLLTDLAGYKVVYGPSPSAMNTVVVLTDPNVTTYVVTDLSSGTWYFAVAAYTSSGTTQSALSNVATKVIN
jgi:hypothetical protein